MLIRQVYNTYGNYNRSLSVTSTQETNIPSFGKASDITIRYALQKKSELLPESVLIKAKEYFQAGKNLDISLLEFHNQIYKQLFNTTTLDEAKAIYPELKGVISATLLDGNKSRAIDIIKSKTDLDNFTLEYLKKLYTPIPLEEIVKDFGFTNVAMLNWLNSKLNIPKLKGNYIILLKNCNEDINSKNANLLKTNVKDVPLIEKKRIAHTTQTWKNENLREKQRQRINHHIAHPEISRNTTYVNNFVYKTFPEIQDAWREFTLENPYIIGILDKLNSGNTLTQEEQSSLKVFRQSFWNKHPDLREKRSIAMKKAYKNLKGE